MTTTDSLLRVENMNTFYGSSHILRDVSFDVEEGKIVTLVGRNGAGKTTSLRSIMGLTPPRSGRVVFDGAEIQGCAPHEARQRGIAWVPEGRGVFPTLTVQENLRLAARSAEPGERQDQLDRVYDLFPRLDERRNQDGGTMSGGEQQMLAIARGLVGAKTELLLLDEPSEGLAPQIVEDVADIVRTLKDDGVTVLLVEQNAQLALNLADRAYIIDNGTIEHEGSAEAIRDNRELMERYLGVR